MTSLENHHNSLGSLHSNQKPFEGKVNSALPQNQTITYLQESGYCYRPQIQESREQQPTAAVDVRIPKKLTQLNVLTKQQQYSFQYSHPQLHSIESYREKTIELRNQSQNNIHSQQSLLIHDVDCEGDYYDIETDSTAFIPGVQFPFPHSSAAATVRLVKNLKDSMDSISGDHIGIHNDNNDNDFADECSSNENFKEHLQQLIVSKRERQMIVSAATQQYNYQLNSQNTRQYDSNEYQYSKSSSTQQPQHILHNIQHQQQQQQQQQQRNVNSSIPGPAASNCRVQILEEKVFAKRKEKAQSTNQVAEVKLIQELSHQQQEQEQRQSTQHQALKILSSNAQQNSIRQNNNNNNNNSRSNQNIPIISIHSADTNRSIQLDRVGKLTTRNNIESIYQNNPVVIEKLNTQHHQSYPAVVVTPIQRSQSTYSSFKIMPHSSQSGSSQTQIQNDALITYENSRTPSSRPPSSGRSSLARDNLLDETHNSQSQQSQQQQNYQFQSSEQQLSQTNQQAFSDSFFSNTMNTQRSSDLSIRRQQVNNPDILIQKAREKGNATQEKQEQQHQQKQKSSRRSIFGSPFEFPLVTCASSRGTSAMKYGSQASEQAQALSMNMLQTPLRMRNSNTTDKSIVDATHSPSTTEISDEEPLAKLRSTDLNKRNLITKHTALNHSNAKAKPANNSEFKENFHVSTPLISGGMRNIPKQNNGNANQNSGNNNQASFSKPAVTAAVISANDSKRVWNINHTPFSATQQRNLSNQNSRSQQPLSQLSHQNLQSQRGFFR